MKGVRRQAHPFAVPQGGLSRLAHPPPSLKRAGRALVRGIELHAQIKRLSGGELLRRSQVDLPYVHVSRRDDLVPRFDLFQDLLSGFGNIGPEVWVLLHALPDRKSTRLNSS